MVNSLSSAKTRQPVVPSARERHTFGALRRPRLPGEPIEVPPTQHERLMAQMARRNSVRSDSFHPRSLARAFYLMVVLTVLALIAVGVEIALAYRTPVAIQGPANLMAETALVALYYDEVWNRNNLTFLDTYVADDHHYQDRLTPDLPAGSQGIAQVTTTWRQALPDLQIVTKDIIAGDGWVTVRFDLTGTHQGPFLNVEGSGRTVAVSGLALHRIRDDLLSETLILWDTLAMATQFGFTVVPLRTLEGEEGWVVAPSLDRPRQPLAQQRRSHAPGPGTD